ncbi:hypothetical protein ACFSJU_06200 [Paradesertivirga mongoliensis]|uniref:Uncharacterized protein n=1 Tax=Paradesertivirga mongoliensis TaxID=2100740 RepID=A0ABW4ZKA9_9SPHI|nr:hypothetical protein [Pedobacter mongoliensis]
MESKVLSSTGFLHEFSIEELYVLTTHWLSDIGFFEQEINYFQSLINRYFLPAVEEQNVMLIQSLASHFESLDLRKEQLKNNIIQHQQHLSTFLDKSQVENEAHLNVLHSNLEGKLFEFIKTLRQIKLEFFNATKFSGKLKKAETKA